MSDETLYLALATALLVSWKVHSYRALVRTHFSKVEYMTAYLNYSLRKPEKNPSPPYLCLRVHEKGVAFQVYLLSLKNVLLLKVEGKEPCKENL